MQKNKERLSELIRSESTLRCSGAEQTDLIDVWLFVLGFKKCFGFQVFSCVSSSTVPVWFFIS